MRRRDFITLVGVTATVWPLATMAQEAGRIYRLGMLLPQPRDAPGSLRLFDELRRRGFIEGQNLTIDYRDYGLHPVLISEYAVRHFDGFCYLLASGDAMN
jgi:putative tryptophan/tyrosine transport system substrate-binding protein